MNTDEELEGWVVERNGERGGKCVKGEEKRCKGEDGEYDRRNGLGNEDRMDERK